jgi:cytochrome c
LKRSALVVPTAVLPLMAFAACGEDGRTPEEARGHALAEAHGCGTCHMISGIEGADGMTGPPLEAMGLQAYVAGVLPNTPEAVAAFVMDPQAVDPRSAMPNLGIGAEDAAAIAAFLYAVGSGR